MCDPATYLLTRAGVRSAHSPEDRWGNIRSREFVSPPASIDKTCVLHEPIVETTAGNSLNITATVVAPFPITKVELVACLPPAPAQDAPPVPLDVAKIESVLVSIGPGLTAAEHEKSHGVQIERIWLE